MIDNNVDQDEWTNSSLYLDRALSLEDQFVDDLFNLHHLPDQPGSVSHRVSFRLRTDRQFQSIFSSLKLGNEVF